MTTSIQDNLVVKESNNQMRVYDLKGLFIMVGSSLDEIKHKLPKGVYLVNQKKIFIK